jgi:hypothetical protein
MESKNNDITLYDEETQETQEDDKIKLKNNIKEWINIDSEIKQLKTEIKERNDKKKKITETLLNVMKKKDIECFDIKDGSILYVKNVVKKPISGKTLFLTLQNYYSDQNSSIDVEELSKYILENREKQTKETIRYKQ